MNTLAFIQMASPFVGSSASRAVRCGELLVKTAHAPIRLRENDGANGVARIELDSPAPSFNCLLPMPKPPLDENHRLENGHIVRKTLLGVLEFCQSAGEITLL